MRFNIRDLLWATVVVCFALGWFLNRVHMQSELSAKLKAQKEELIIEFIKERNHKEGLFSRFEHPDYPSPTDPNAGKGVIDLSNDEDSEIDVGPIPVP